MQLKECIYRMSSMNAFIDFAIRILNDKLLKSDFKNDDFLECLAELENIWRVNNWQTMTLDYLSVSYNNCYNNIGLKIFHQKTLEEAGFILYVDNGMNNIFVSNEEIRHYYSYSSMIKLIFITMYEFEMTSYGNDDIPLEDRLRYFYRFCQQLRTTVEDEALINKNFKVWCPVLQYCYENIHGVMNQWAKVMNKRRSKVRGAVDGESRKGRKMGTGLLSPSCIHV